MPNTLLDLGQVFGGFRPVVSHGPNVCQTVLGFGVRIICYGLCIMDCIVCYGFYVMGYMVWIIWYGLWITMHVMDCMVWIMCYRLFEGL